LETFQRYDVLLERLTLDKIELVRNWRNDPKISQYMDFREYITSEMQLNWFNKINNDNNYYFIVIYKNENIGLTNIKDIDYIKKCGEPGLFIYKDEYLNTDVGFRIALCYSDFAFDYLNLEYLSGHVLSNNKRSIRFSKALGYIIPEDQADKMKLSGFLTKERYLEHKEKIIKLLH
jgi:UDP-4-amino-4,6-dideoxy-N-acetyl-beta-L-altrosamine N-acetyltransferase